MEPRTAKLLIQNCKACPLALLSSGPVPFSGPAPNKIAVIGEAPGATEDKKGEPFVGAAGQMIRRLLRRVGFDPTELTYMNVVSCWPRGTPGLQSIQACRHNVDMQLEVIQPKYALVLGGVALSWWINSKKDLAADSVQPKNLNITSVHGMWWKGGVANSTWMMCTFHPAAMLRNPDYGQKILQDLMYFRWVVCGDEFDYPNEDMVLKRKVKKEQLRLL